MTIYKQVTNGKDGMPQPGLDAAREDRDFFNYVTSKTLAANGVLTDATFLRTLWLGERYVITSFTMYLSSVSDSVAITFGVTANADGTGVYTRLTPTYRIDTAAALVQASPTIQHFDPPLVVDRTDGQAFTAYLTVNDATTVLDLGYSGWYEITE